LRITTQQVFTNNNVLFYPDHTMIILQNFILRLFALTLTETFPPTTEPPSVQNKSTTVLTRPSTPHQSPNESTGNPTDRVEMVFYSSPTKGIENEEESTSVAYGFVLYNGENVYTISSALVALILSLEIFM